jgi:xylulokinase
MHILGLDIGTSGCKAILFDNNWNVIDGSSREYNLINAGENKFDLEGETVWEKLQEAILEIHSKTAQKVDAVSVSALGDVIIPLDKRGHTVRPSIIDFDPRGKEEIYEFIENFGAERLYKITGMPPIHINSLAKILWIKKNEPQNYENTHRWATFEDYILQKLGIEPTVSYSLAARTMLFDIHQKSWSREIIDAVGLNESSLPEAVPSGKVVAKLDGEKAGYLGFSRNAVACSGGHDMVCAAIGAGLDVSDPGMALNIVGTVEGIIVLSKKPRINREMFKNLYPCYPGYREYLSLSLNLTSGSILKWYRDLFSSFHVHHDQVNDYRALLSSIDDKHPGELLLIPHFSGTCNPTFDPDARGSLYGLSLNTTLNDLIQGIVEGLCFEMKAHIEGFTDAGVSIDRLKIVGGGSQSIKWLQLKANITGLEVISSDLPQASAVGAAALSGTAVGITDNPYGVAGYIKAKERRYTPSEEAAERFKEKFSQYQMLNRHIEKFRANR